MAILLLDNIKVNAKTIYFTLRHFETPTRKASLSSFKKQI